MTAENSNQQGNIRPTDGKGLYELAMQMRNSGQMFDFSNQEWQTIHQYMEENGLIKPDNILGVEAFFALDKEKQKEQINQMDAQDLLDWYDELNRNLDSGSEYVPTAEEKASFYQNAFLRVIELGREVNENTAEKIELQKMFALYHAYWVDFENNEVQGTKPEEARFMNKYQAMQTALQKRFPINEENDDENENIDGNETLEEITANSIIYELSYYTDIGNGDKRYDLKDYDGNIFAPWTDEEIKRKDRLDNFFKNVKIEYDDEWHKDIAMRLGSVNEEQSAYTVEKMKNDVYQLAQEATIQQILEQKNGDISLDDFNNPEFIREIRQAVLDQREQICISILETQISKDLVYLSKEEAHEKAQAQYAKVSANRDSDAKLSRIDKIAQKLGLANNGTILLQDSSILSAIAAKSTLLKENATNLITKFKENTVAGKLFVKSQERIKNFEAKLAKEHPYLNVVYSSAKMITAGAVIGALGSPVATTAWIAYNVAKADKAFYNEYKKHCQQTGEKGFWKYAAKNPWRTTLTAASNVGIALGLVDGSAGGAVRMISGGAGAISAAAKDFAQGNWKMGLTKVATFAAGYWAGGKLHEIDGATNAAENSDNTSCDAKTNENISNVPQEVYDKAVQDVNQYAQNMKLNLEQPDLSPQPETSDNSTSVQQNTESHKVFSHHTNNNVASDSSSVDNEVKSAEDQKTTNTTENTNTSSDELSAPEQYVEQPPHAPALNENNKIVLIGGAPIESNTQVGLIETTVEQSSNGVVETEIGHDGKIAMQRSIIEENGVKHCVITQNGETRYMTPEDENHFISRLSNNGTIGRADAGTAELLAEIHNMPAVQDVERAEFMAAQQEKVDLVEDDNHITHQPKTATQPDTLVQQANIDKPVETVTELEMLRQQSEEMVIKQNVVNQPQENIGQQSATAMHQQKVNTSLDTVEQQPNIEIKSATVTQPEMLKQPQEEITQTQTVSDEEQSETYKIGNQEYAANNGSMQFASIINDMNMSKVTNDLYNSANAMMLSTADKPGEFILFTVEDNKAHFYEVHDGKPTEVGQERAEQLFDKMAEEINNSHTKEWYDAGYKEEHARFVSNAEQLNKFMLIRGFENAENLQHFSQVAALENVKLDTSSMQTFVAEDLSSATTVANDGIVIHQKDGTETFVKYDADAQKLIAKTGPSYEQHNLSAEETKAFLAEHEDIFIKAGLQNSEFAKAAYGDIVLETENSAQQATVGKSTYEILGENNILLYSGPEGHLEQTSNGFILHTDQGEKITVTRLDDEHVSWVKEDAQGHQTALTGPEADKAYAQIYSHLPESSEISFEFQNMKLDYDTEQTALRVAATRQIIDGAQKEIEAGKAQEAEADAAQKKANAEITDISTQQILSINNDIGLENGQIREIDGKVVTMSNNGFSICSKDGSIAMVLENDGKIHGYSFNADGAKTEMTPAQVNQQYRAALPKLEGTAYQNSDFVKNATHNYINHQYQRTRF